MPSVLGRDGETAVTGIGWRRSCSGTGSGSARIEPVKRKNEAMKMKR